MNVVQAKPELAKDHLGTIKGERYEMGKLWRVCLKQRLYKYDKISQLSIFACTVHLAARKYKS